jgi:hypothetical protein
MRSTCLNAASRRPGLYCFVGIDSAGQKLSYIYFEDELRKPALDLKQFIEIVERFRDAYSKARAIRRHVPTWRFDGQIGGGADADGRNLRQLRLCPTVDGDLRTQSCGRR